MEKEYWSITEVVEIFSVKERFIRELESEEIICGTVREGTQTRTYCARDLEKLRLAKLLTEEMDVNLPGVEVILRMRQNMLEMRRQFDDILFDLAEHLQQNLISEKRSEGEKG